VRSRALPRSLAAPGWLRALALLAVALLGGEQVLPSLHYALVRHEVCPEHGELVHVGQARHEVVQHGRTAHFETGAVEEAPHAHCGSLPASTQAAAPVATAAGCPLPERSLVATIVPRASVTPSANVLSFAPKQSPPA